MRNTSGERLADRVRGVVFIRQGKGRATEWQRIYSGPWRETEKSEEVARHLAHRDAETWAHKETGGMTPYLKRDGLLTISLEWESEQRE